MSAEVDQSGEAIPTPAGRACVFCGGVAGSEEHMFPKWLNRVFAYNAKRQGPAEWTMTSAGGDEPIVRTFSKADIATLTTGYVCSTCNTGWMSELETRAIPILRPLIERGMVVTQPENDTLVMATWAVKTAMTLLTGVPRIEELRPPRDDYEIVRTQDRPPTFYGIFAAALQRPGPALSYAAASIHVELSNGARPCDLHIYTIQIGGLVLQVNRTSPPLPLFGSLEEVAIPVPHEVPLFPPVGAFQWTPRDILDWDGYIRYTTRGIALRSDWAPEWRNPGADF